MTTSISKTKAFWLEYADEELSDERATTIYENTLAFTNQVLKMQKIINEQKKGKNICSVIKKIN